MASKEHQQSYNNYTEIKEGRMNIFTGIVVFIAFIAVIGLFDLSYKKPDHD